MDFFLVYGVNGGLRPLLVPPSSASSKASLHTCAAATLYRRERKVGCKVVVVAALLHGGVMDGETMWAIFQRTKSGRF